MSDEPETEEEKATREARGRARMRLPAVYVDTWGFTTWFGHIRIAMGEEDKEVDLYRFAFLMELDSAEIFAKHILESVARRKRRDEAVTRRRMKSSDDAADEQ